MSTLLNTDLLDSSVAAVSEDSSAPKEGVDSSLSESASSFVPGTSPEPLTHEQVQQFGTNDPKDVFAAQFMTYYPRFAALLTQVSNNKMRKIIKNLIAGPLAEKPYNPTDKVERELFIIGSKLLFSRFTLEFTELAKHFGGEAPIGNEPGDAGSPVVSSASVEDLPIAQSEQVESNTEQKE